MSRNGIGNFNASDIIRRNQERMLMVAKMRNDYAKQQSLTIQPLQSGRSGGGPITSQFIPKMKQTAATALTVDEYFTILNGIITELGGGTDASGGGGGGGGYTPTGEPSVLYSLPYIVQGIVLDAQSNRIILTYDLSNNQYYIYKVLSTDPSGNLTQMVVDNKLLINNANNMTMFINKIPTNNNYYLANYSTISSHPFPTIVQYDSNFNYVTTKVIRDSSGVIMLEGGITACIESYNNLYCAGWFRNNSSSAYILDDTIFPSPYNGSGRFTPFFAKLDSNLRVKWVGLITPHLPNSLGSTCIGDSQGNIYLGAKVQGGSDLFYGDVWDIRSGNSIDATVSQTAQTIIAKYTSSNVYSISKQLIAPGFYSYGDTLGMQFFVDSNDNLFVAYNTQFTDNSTNITENYDNGISITFHRTTTLYNALIYKLNSNLEVQAVWQLEMPSNLYRLYIKSVAFDFSGNLLINTAYTTNGQVDATITDNHGNSVVLKQTNGGNRNAMDISLSNDLSTINWYFNIENINTDTQISNGYYKNNGQIIVDTTNNKLIKIDERANTGTVTVATGLTLPISSGINTSYLIEYS